MHASDVKAKCGGGLLEHYSGSLVDALLAVYPDYSWMVWKFSSVPNGFWNLLNQKKFFDWLGNELHFTRTEDWYHLKAEDIRYFEQLKMTQEGKMVEEEC